MAPRLLVFGDELRREGVAVGTSELLDAFAALEAVPWTGSRGLPGGAGGHAGQVAGGPPRVRAVFERFFFRAVEREAVERGISEGTPGRRAGEERNDLDALRERIRDALRAPEGSDGELRDLARLAIAAFGRQGEGPGVIGVDVQRIRRALGLKGEQPAPPRPDPEPCRASGCASSRPTCAASSNGR